MQALSEPLNTTQYLTFNMAGEEYAVGISHIREIIEYDTITKVPGTPPYIKGVINLRGNVVPIIDLAVKFGFAETQVTRFTCIVILDMELEGEQTLMGVMTDMVNQVIELSSEDIEEPPPFGTQVHIDYLLGMGKAGKKFALILDIDKVLSARELLAAEAYAHDSETKTCIAGDRRTPEMGILNTTTQGDGEREGISGRADVETHEEEG